MTQTNVMRLERATRKQVKLKLNISGPAGSGKTMGALLMAKGLVGDWNKIAVIDTENSSASLYSDLGEFLTINLSAPFSPERYTEAIDICLSNGIQCIIIDSSTHEWNGAGGCIEMNERMAQSKFKGNSWSAWSDTTPKHDKFVNKVLQCDCHVITCTRSKMETVMGDDKKVKKLGMKDMQRDGWEYELTVSLSIDRDTHMAIASKDRTNVFERKDPFVITEETGRLIKDWCDKGAAPVSVPSTPVAHGITIKEKVMTRLKEADTILKLSGIYGSLADDMKRDSDVIKLKDELKIKLTPKSNGTTNNNATSTPITA